MAFAGRPAAFSQSMTPPALHAWHQRPIITKRAHVQDYRQSDAERAVAALVLVHEDDLFVGL
jgi:hypothetical protein